MDKSAWKENFSIGVQSIDQQHQELIDLLERCTKKSIASRDEFERLFVEMKTCADIHFKTEEKMMQTLNYPELAEHQKQHRLFEENLELLEEEMKNWKKFTVITLTSLLRDWFIQHILDCDKKIGVHIRAGA